MIQVKARRILLVTAVTAMLTAGGAGLAYAYTGGSPDAAETGYMVVEPAAAEKDCPEQAQATLTHDRAGL